MGCGADSDTDVEDVGGESESVELRLPADSEWVEGTLKPLTANSVGDVFDDFELNMERALRTSDGAFREVDRSRGELAGADDENYSASDRPWQSGG